MTVEAQVTINASRESIWDVITNIHNAAQTISGIKQVEVLDKPETGLVGLKWRETRTLFGKTATEEMWVTDSVDNEFYKTRAESHGCVYISSLRISENNGSSTLTMTHESRPQGFVARLLSLPLALAFKGALRKMLVQDLHDIKAAVEQP